MQMVMVDSVAEVLTRHFVPLQIPGQPTIEMIQIIVVVDVVCPGGYISDHKFILLTVVHLLILLGYYH